jgi:signal transduction histidine kinase
MKIRKLEPGYNYSISLKLTLTVIIISAIVFFSLTFINIQEQALSLENVYSDKAVDLSQAMDAFIFSQYQLEGNFQLQNFLINLSEKNPEIQQININIFEEDELKTYYSTDINQIGNISSNYNYVSFKENAVINIPKHSVKSHEITVVIPINISGNTIGTYQILLTMNSSYNAFNEKVLSLILISIIGLIILIICILFIFRILIVKPLLLFRDTAREIGKGDLSKRININSKDEIGELSNAFNQMTKNLELSKIKIHEYNEKLKDLIDQKDEFIGQLGHDLKNPLQPLVGLLPIIIQKEKDPEIIMHLQILSKNVDYMRNLIVKTLKLARLKSPNIMFDMDDLHLKSQVDDIIDTQKYIISNKNLHIENNIADDIYIYADKLRIDELIKNLLSNSIKYTSGSNGKIVFNSNNENDELITISIQDSGIGMTREELSKVFNEFYKADHSRHEMSSSGLGLSICKRIVEKHGGRIWVDSPGKYKGSIFYFTLKKSNKKIDKVLKDLNNSDGDE